MFAHLQDKAWREPRVGHKRTKEFLTSCEGIEIFNRKATAIRYEYGSIRAELDTVLLITSTTLGKFIHEDITIALSKKGKLFGGRISAPGSSVGLSEQTPPPVHASPLFASPRQQSLHSTTKSETNHNHLHITSRTGNHSDRHPYRPKLQLASSGQCHLHRRLHQQIASCRLRLSTFIKYGGVELPSTWRNPSKEQKNACRDCRFAGSLSVQGFLLVHALEAGPWLVASAAQMPHGPVAISRSTRIVQPYGLQRFMRRYII